MGFSFLYQFDSKLPGYYQRNIFEYVPSKAYLYEKVRPEDPDLPTKTISKTTASAIRNGLVYRKIDRATGSLPYEFVELQFRPYPHEIQQLLWDTVNTIPKDTKKYCSGFELVDDLRAKVDYAKTTNHGKELAGIVKLIQDTKHEDVIKLFNAISPILWTLEMAPASFKEDAFQPFADMVQQEREFGAELLKDSRVMQVVAEVLHGIWRFVVATEETQEAVRDFFCSMEKRRKTPLLYPGTVAACGDDTVKTDYEAFEAVAKPKGDGNLREKMLMINAFGYGGCALWFRVLHAYVDREKDKAWEGMEALVPDTSDVAHRVEYLKQQFGAHFFDDDAIKREEHFGRKYCREVRSTKYGLIKNLGEEINLKNPSVSELKKKGYGAVRLPLEPGSPLQISRMPRVKDVYPPLSTREIAMLKAGAGKSDNFKAAKVYSLERVWNADKLQEATSAMLVPWYTGYSNFQVNFRYSVIYELFKEGRMAVMTPSSSSNLMMDIAFSFIANDDKKKHKLFFFECALIAWMTGPPSHSAVEVLQGFPYKEAGVNSATYDVSQDPFQFVRDELAKKKKVVFGAHQEHYADDIDAEIKEYEQMFRRYKREFTRFKQQYLN